MRAHGYDGIDYQGLCSIENSPLYKMPEGELERYLIEFKECAHANGLQIHQLHGVWPHVDDATREGRNKTIEYLKSNIRCAQKLGCPHVVIHPCMPSLYTDKLADEQEEFEVNGYLLESLAPVAKECGVMVCFENMPFPQKSAFSSVSNIKRLLSQVQNEHIKACLDCGHFNCEKKDIREAICLLGSDLAALHVHDDRHAQDRHLIPFQGDIDWDGFIQGLKAIGYQGYISLETWIREKTPQPMLEQMQIQLSNIAQYFAEEIEK